MTWVDFALTVIAFHVACFLAEARMARTSPLRNTRTRVRKVHDKIGIYRTDDELAYDKRIGTQLLAGRVMRDVSQTMLATELGITFQQIQKYETAKNRISASRLLSIARVLDLPTAWFLEGIPQTMVANDLDLPELAVLMGRISRLPEREQRILMRLLDELERSSVANRETGAER